MRSTKDTQWMLQALLQARISHEDGEVPVGAVVVQEDAHIIGAGRNSVLRDCNPCSHAEMIAIAQACKQQANYRLSDCTIYTTVEPCLMCIGGILHSRIKKLVYATESPVYGCFSQCIITTSELREKHKIHVKKDVCAAQAKELMQKFFKNIRYIS